MDYKDQCTLSTATYNVLDVNSQRPGQHNSSDITMHYSFDYLQQVHYPTDSQQASPVYFLTRRKCAIFTVSCKASGRSIFYIIDEADNYGKGANSTCSLFHHYLSEQGLGEKHLALRQLCWAKPQQHLDAISHVEVHDRSTQHNSCLDYAGWTHHILVRLGWGYLQEEMAEIKGCIDGAGS